MKKKLLSIIILAALALISAAAAWAAEAASPAPLFPANPYYMEFAGKVQTITPYYNADGSESDKLFVLTENAEGALMNFVVDENTCMLTEGELKPGADIIGFYLGGRPAILIYPPQHQAALLAVDLPENLSLKAAFFDATLLSDDNELKLNIGENTEIVLPNGEPAPADTELTDRPLAVFYSFTTFSIPAQTAPTRVVVLDATEPPAEEPAAEIPSENLSGDNMPLCVENVLLLSAPPVYVQSNGTVMVPLRAVAEALGYEVGWQSGVVTLDGQALVTVGQEGAELHEGSTYVPLAFFRSVLGLNNAYVLENQVYIDNGEKIQ